MEKVYPMSQCELACDRNPACLSFNFNSAKWQCEILGTDLTLQGLAPEEGNPSVTS